MRLNIIEGMSLQEVAALASENGVTMYIKSRFGTFIKNRIEVDGKKIWIPKDYRAKKEDLLTGELKLMKLKEMGSPNGDIAFFLEPNDSHIIGGMKFRDLRANNEYSHRLIIYPDNSLVGGIKIGGVPIYFPLLNRMSPGEFDLSAYDNLLLRSSEGDRIQYFLISPHNR